MKLSTLAVAIRQPALALRLAGARLYEMRHPNDPWIAPGAVLWCQEHLTRTMIGLEWGSGRSTRWFAARLKTLTSVEHDREWYEKVRAELEGIENVQYRFAPLDHPVSEGTRPRYDVTPRYVAIAESFDDGSLDFVVIDGHYRQACVIAALPKLRSGGFLLIDNSDWVPRSAWPVPETYPVVHQSRWGRGETTIWRKP